MLYKSILRTSLLQESIEKLSKLIFLSKLTQFLPNFGSEKGFKGIVVNWALPSLHGGSLKIMLLVPSKTVELKYIVNLFGRTIQIIVNY